MTADTAQNAEASAATPAPAAASTTATPAPSKPIPLAEFCRARSVRMGRKIEILSGFHHTEKIAGRLLDTAANYEQRFQAYTTATPTKVSPERLAQARINAARFAAEQARKKATGGRVNKIK